MVAEPENDNDNDVKFNIEFVKRLTGRDEITTRDLHKSNISYKPTFTLFLQTNEPPKIDKVEQALSRRFMCLNFPFNFVEKPTLEYHRKINYELKDKIQNPVYYTEFMGLLIDFIRNKFHQQKLTVPQIVKDTTKEYMNENNVVGKFIEEYIEITNNKKDRLKFSELYELYKEHGEVSLTKSKFKYNLIQNNFIERKIGGIRLYTNIKIKCLDLDEY